MKRSHKPRSQGALGEDPVVRPRNWDEHGKKVKTRHLMSRASRPGCQSKEAPSAKRNGWSPPPVPPRCHAAPGSRRRTKTNINWIWARATREAAVMPTSGHGERTRKSPLELADTYYWTCFLRSVSRASK